MREPNFGWDLPPGLSHSHPYFNPPVCPECGYEGVTEGENCPDCDHYIASQEDYEDERAEREFERRREEGPDH